MVKTKIYRSLSICRLLLFHQNPLWQSEHQLDGITPPSILMNAKGFAIFSVIKAGFVLSTQVGSGVVTAKFDDESMGNTSGVDGTVYLAHSPSFLKKPEPYPPAKWGTETASVFYFTSEAPQSHSQNMTWDGATHRRIISQPSSTSTTIFMGRHRSRQPQLSAPQNNTGNQASGFIQLDCQIR